MSTTIDNFRSRHALWVAEMIQKHGHAIISVGSGECDVPGCRCVPEPVTWSYTIGLVEDDLPELVAFGLCFDDAAFMLNWAARRARCPHCGVDPGTVVELGDFPIRFDAVPVEWAIDTVADPLGCWWAHYSVGRSAVPAPSIVQCVWADGDGRFPDDPECDPAVVAAQPVGNRLLGDWSGERPNRAERRAARRRHRR